MSERLDNQAVAERTLDELRRAGVRDGEVFLRDSQSTSVEISDGAVENIEARGERGVGVRLLDEQRVGFAFTSNLTAAGIARCVELARVNARITTPDESLAIAAESPAQDDLAIHEPGFADRRVEAKIEIAFEIEAAARATDPRVRTFRKTHYGDGESTTLFATTGGAFAAYRETGFGAGTAAMAMEDSDKQIGYFGDVSRSFARLDPSFIGKEAARRAVEKLGARTFATQKIDLILEPYMAMGLLGAIASLFSAENVLKGKSLLRDKLGDRVASERVTIHDDARRPGGHRSAPFDGEGTATRSLTLVEGGALRGYLHSIKTAYRMRAERTGNARRGSYAATPHIGVSNFSIAPGRRSPEEIVASTERALAITSLLNLHTVDPISGDFSLAATATYLERGVPTYPVKGIAIAGNLIEFLTAIADVGDDLRFGSSGIGSPTLLVRDVSVSGT